MATDRDKTITELCERYKDDDIDACEDLAREVWEAARADATEECAKALQAKFEDINQRAQTYSLSHHDEKSFALNQQRLGALEMLDELRSLLLSSLKAVT